MKRYYARRAPEYEAIYARPERQPELRDLRAWLLEQVRGRRVLEVACGTGYWTAVASASAAAIAAYDINPETLAIARAKQLGAHVSFAVGDAYAPPTGPFDCVLAGFWWSHVPRARIGVFVRALAAAALPGAQLVLIDNAFAAASSTPIARADADGNTYQLRRLADGSTHEVLKNFPDAPALQAALEPHCSRIEPVFLRYYWRLTAAFKTI